MRSSEFIFEKWSQKYKSSINCSHPKGFSQKAHCAGKNKQNESVEMEMTCEDCGMCQTHGSLNEIKKGAKDSNGYTRCWPGKHAEGTKKGKNGGQVRNCVPNESIAESTEGRCRQCGMKNCKCPGDSCKCKPIAGWVPNKGFRKAMDEGSKWRNHPDAHEPDDSDELDRPLAIQPKGGYPNDELKGRPYSWAEKGKVTPDAAARKKASIKSSLGKHHKANLPEQGVAEELSEEFDLIESIIESIAAQNGVDAEAVWADLESLTEDELYAFAVTSQLNEDWQKANKRDKTDGMSQKAVNSYRREHPGSKLKTAVTTKPGKLKKGGKASKRRKSYCSRSRGQMKMHSISCAKTPDKAICKARRRWNC